MKELFYSLSEFIPDDHSRQVTPRYFTEILFGKDNNILEVMDLGCGEGNSMDYFQLMHPQIKWVGLDIEDSPEVKSRKRADGDFHSFDGIHIPFGDNHFDLIYCNQVFEHVRYPEKLLKEVFRVLRPGGYLVGSTSQLEPFHSFSFWNYTPYGFSLMVKEAGLQMIEIRPSIDAVTLIARRGLGKPKFFLRWWEKESPLNVTISFVGKILRKRHSSINSMKLLFCGQFCFLVTKRR